MGQPNEALQQTGHATDGTSGQNGSFRVSRRLTLVLGGLQRRWRRAVLRAMELGDRVT
jgi:hypothetical protein